MDSLKSLIFLGVYISLLYECKSQKFSFSQPVDFNTSNDLLGQTSTWFVNGEVDIDDNDFIMFEPTMSIHTCHKVCTVDLTRCDQPKVPDTSDDCYCKEKFGTTHRVHVSSPALASQSGADVTATIASRSMFKPVTMTSVLGVLPVIPRRTRAEATLQIEAGPTQDLLPLHNISVCPGAVTLKVCVPRKKTGAVLKIRVQDHQSTTVSEDTCVRIVEKYIFDVISSYTLTFSYTELKPYHYMDVFKIYVRQNNDCKQSKEIAPKQTKNNDLKTDTKSSQVIVKEVTSLKQTVQSLKLEFENEIRVVNGTMSQLTALENGQMHFVSLLKDFDLSHKNSFNELSKNINTSYKSVQQNIDSLSHTIGLLNNNFTEHYGDNYCTMGSGCEIKPNQHFRCYRVELNIKTSWHNAVKNCQAIGGYLAEVHDSFSLEYVKRVVIQAVPASEQVWLGASDEAYEGIWTWTTSEKQMTISDWSIDNPDNSRGEESCLEVRIDEKTPKALKSHWNDRKCSEELGYICQKNGDSCGDWQ